MTNHRPDIYCNGCGGYAYSLSHRHWEQEFPKEFFCKECIGAVSRKVATRAMLAHQWILLTGEVRAVFEIERPFDARGGSKIASFVHTMHTDCFPDEAPAEAGPNTMSVASWQSYAEKKLAVFAKHCTLTELTFLRAYIAAAALLAQPTKKIVAAREAEQARRDGSVGAVILRARQRVRR